MSDFTEAIEKVLKNEGGYTVDHAGPTNYGITLQNYILWLNHREELNNKNKIELLELYTQFDWNHFTSFEGAYVGHPKYASTMHLFVSIYDQHKCMTADDAKQYYFDEWWAKYKFGSITNTKFATKIFDMYINMGPTTATRIVQRACRALGWTLVEDGKMGPKTREAVNEQFTMNLIQCIRCECAGYYRSLAVKNPEKYGKFLKGWLRRAYDEED